MTEALTSNYWISPNAVRITLNAMGEKDHIQCGATGGAVIMCYMRDVEGLSYDAGHNYRRWPIVTAPTYFNTTTRKYVYIAIPRSTAVGSNAMLVFPSERIDLYGMTEPAEGEAEGTQIGSKDYYYIFLRGVISASKTDGGADQLREWEEYIDYGTLSTDQAINEGDAEWWRYNADDDTVTFLKVITNATFKVLNVLKSLIVGGDASIGKNLSVGGTLDVKGQATIDNIKSHNYTGDGIADTGWSLTNSYNGHSKLTIDEIYVRMKAVFESLEVRERTYTGGDQIWSCAGNYVHRTDYMTDTPKTVWVEADGTERTDEAETEEEKAAAARRAQDIMDEEGIDLYEVLVAGNTVGYSMVKVPWLLKGMALVLGKNNGLVRGLFAHHKKVRITMRRSPAHGGSGDESDEQVLATVRRVRCYFLAKDNERQVHNWWRINDLARCQTMNLENIVRETYLESANSKTGNVFWWRKVIGVSTNPVRLEDGKWYHYFDVAFNSKIEESTDPSIHASMATFAMEGSDIPAAGDSVVQFGNTIIEGRMNLMMMEVNGGDSIGYSPSTDAPCLKAYRGIYCFDLNKCWVGGSPCKMKLSPSTGYEFYGPNIKFVTEYAIVPVPIERPEIYWTNICRAKDAMGNWIDSWTFEEDAYNRAEPMTYSDDAKTHRDYSSFINPDGSVRAGAPVRKCYYYEKVSHNGCYFICSIVDGAHWEAEETFVFGGVTYPANRWINDGTYNSFSPECQGKCKRVPNYTIEEPSAESQDWTMTVNRGSEPIAVYKWAQEGTSISAPTINKAQWAAWTDGSQPIDGWTKTAPNRPTQNPETWYLFMSQNTLYADGSISTWSTPTRISGSQGTPGEDAGDTEWIYLINNSSVNPGAPNNITNGTIPDPNNPGQRIPSTDKTKDDWVPNGWTDNPDGIAWNQQYEWASFRTKAKGANVDPNIRWSDFSVPIIWSHWGQNGMDGDGVEYVYMRTKNNVKPIVAYNDNINRTAHGKTYLDDEYLPVINNNDATKSDATKAWAESNECTDDPKGISRDWPYEWCLKRVMTPANAETGKRTWRCYGGTAAGQTQEMDLWNHYAENAIRLDLDNEMDSVQTDSQGKILSAREVSTVIRLWDGATEVDISAVDFTASGRISGSPASTVATFSQAASGKGKQLKWTFIAEQSMPTAYEIIISYVYLNETHRCTLTIAASMGQPVYQLKPSRSSLPCTVNSSNTYNNPPVLSLSVVKVDGASTDEITTIGSGGTIESGIIFIRYSLDSMPTGKTAGSAWPTANSVQATSDKENVYIAMFNAAGTLLDRETIPIVKDGKNGENAIRLDLDNENDSMLYTGEGTLVSGNVTSKAYMFDGANDVSSQTTWSATASGCTITNASKTSRDIEVTGMTAATAKVTVQGVYKDSHNNTHTKTAVLTLKKIVDGDKYDLIITPNSIAYNSSTDTPAASTIDIQVWKTSVNSSGGVNRVQAPPPTGYAVYAGSTALTAVSTGKYSYTTDNSAISEVQIKIAKTTDLNDILDAETIPVNKAKNGENSIRLALDNEHEDFLYSKDGLVAPSGGATSQAHLYDGPTEISASNVGWAVSCDGGSTYVNAGSSFTTGSVAKAKISSAGLLTVGEIYVNAAKVKVRAKYPNNSSGKFYYAEFTGNKTNQDKYDIIVKPNAISYNSSDTWVDKTITISAEGIDAQGNKLTPSIAKEATPVYGKFYVFFGYVNSDGSIRDIDNLMGNSFMLSKLEADSCEGLYFELRYYNDANDATKYRLCDYETVEIAKTVNGSDAEQVNPNILLRTIFDNGITPVKEKWVAEWEHVYIDTANDTITDGRKSIRINANGLSSYVDFKQDVYGRLKPNTWYTLSFNSYANYPWHTYIYPGSEGYTCLDRTEWYIDGVRSTSVPINGRVEWPANWQGKRHTITFKTSSSFSTEKIDIIFRALAGVQVCICMPKLEIGKTATAYMANEDDLIGADGSNAYVVVPENLIINQNLDGSMPTTDDILFKVKSGGSEWNGTVASVGTITDYLPTLPSGATGLSEHHSQASISSGKLKITSIGYYSYTYGGKTITSYYDHVSFAMTVTANGVTVSHIFHVYINLLGSFKTTIEGDIEESIATKTYYVYDKDGNVVGSQTIGDFIRSSSTNTSILTETVNGNTTDISQIKQTTKQITLSVEHNADGIAGRNFLINSGVMSCSDEENYIIDEEGFKAALPQTADADNPVYIGVSCWYFVLGSNSNSGDNDVTPYTIGRFGFDQANKFRTVHRIGTFLSITGTGVAVYNSNGENTNGELICCAAWEKGRGDITYYPNPNNETTAVKTNVLTNSPEYDELVFGNLTRVRRVYKLTYTNKNNLSFINTWYGNQLLLRDVNGNRSISSRSQVGYGKLEILSGNDVNLITEWSESPKESISYTNKLQNIPKAANGLVVSGFHVGTSFSNPITGLKLPASVIGELCLMYIDIRVDRESGQSGENILTALYLNAGKEGYLTEGAYTFYNSGGNSYTNALGKQAVLSCPSPYSGFTRYFVIKRIKNYNKSLLGNYAKTAAIKLATQNTYYPVVDYDSANNNINVVFSVKTQYSGTCDIADIGICTIDRKLIEGNYSTRTAVELDKDKIVLQGDKVIFTNAAGNVTNKISIDPTTGTLNAVDGNFSGILTAQSYYQKWQQVSVGATINPALGTAILLPMRPTSGTIDVYLPNASDFNYVMLTIGHFAAAFTRSYMGPCALTAQSGKHIYIVQPMPNDTSGVLITIIKSITFVANRVYRLHSVPINSPSTENDWLLEGDFKGCTLYDDNGIATNIPWE